MANDEVSKPGRMLVIGGAGPSLTRGILELSPSLPVDFSSYEVLRSFYLGRSGVDHFEISSAASKGIARAVWALWQERPERIWDMIATWSEDVALDTGDFMDSGLMILEIGLSEGHLRIEPTLVRLRDWLGSGVRLREISARILPKLLVKMEAERVAAIFDEWIDERRAESLGIAIAHLFELKPKSCLKMMRSWIRAGTPQMETLLVACFRQLRVPPLVDAHEYHQLELALRSLRLQLKGQRAHELKAALHRFLQSIHARMSAKAGEDALRQEGPFRLRRVLRARSRRPPIRPRKGPV